MRCVGADEVEMENHEIDGMNKVFKLLAVTERQAGKSAIEQAHGKVLAFHVAGADKVAVWIAISDMDSKARANCGRIAAFRVIQVSGIGILLHQLGKINVLANPAAHTDFVWFKSVGGELEMADNTLAHVFEQGVGVGIGALADDMGNDKLGL